MSKISETIVVSFYIFSILATLTTLIIILIPFTIIAQIIYSFQTLLTEGKVRLL